MYKKEIDLKTVYLEVLEELKKEKAKKTLVIFYKEKDKPSKSFLKQITKIATLLKVNIILYKSNILFFDIIKIKHLNKKKNIDGILILKPKDKSYKYTLRNKIIHKEKNVDNLENPNTTKATLYLLKKLNITKKEKIVILGKGILTGLPLYNHLKEKQYNVTLCDSKTPNIKNYTTKADVLISAIGKPNYIDSSYIKEESIVLSLGTSYKNKKYYSDLNEESLMKKAKLITPKINGMGLLTTIFLFKNLYKKETK